MREPEGQSDRLQIPLLYAFRDAFEKRDATRVEDVRKDGDRVISERASMRRWGIEEPQLKRDLAADLSALVDTIDLASVVDMEGLDYARKSILNYGLADITHITLGSIAVEGVADALRAALIEHEPRLGRESVVIEHEKEDDEIGQKVRFRISADLVCKPFDIPIEFVDEVESTSGKVVVQRLPGSA
jgi:type VI secretion system protein ImpF